VILLVALVVADAWVTFPSRPSSIKYRDKLLVFAALVGGCTNVFQKSSMMKRGDDLAQCAMRVLSATFVESDLVHSSRQSLSNIARRRAHSVFVCESFAESGFSSSDS
jgi:hypothetical protein